MVMSSSHLMVMPPVYEIQLGMWRWCKLGEVCDVVGSLREITGTNFTPSSYELIHRFAALTRRNKIHDGPFGSPEKKIFRYSPDGTNLMVTKVPFEPPMSSPPYTPFMLSVGTLPRTLFVPEGWVIDTLKAVRQGCVAAADFGYYRVGFKSRDAHGRLHYECLDGRKEWLLLKFPDCVEKY